MAPIPATILRKKSLGQLQGLCAHKGVSRSGNKTDLITRLLKDAAATYDLDNKTTEELSDMCKEHNIVVGRRGKDKMKDSLMNHLAVVGGGKKRKAGAPTSAVKGKKYYVLKTEDTVQIMTNKAEAYKTAIDCEGSVIAFDSKDKADEYLRRQGNEPSEDVPEAEDSDDAAKEESTVVNPYKKKKKMPQVVTPPRSSGGSSKMKAQLQKRISSQSRDQFRVMAKEFPGSGKVVVLLDITSRNNDGSTHSYWSYKGDNLKHVFNMTSEEGVSFAALKHGDTAESFEIRREAFGPDEARQVSVTRKVNGVEKETDYKDYGNYFIISKPKTQDLKTCVLAFAEKMKKFLAQNDIPEFYSMVLADMYGLNSKISKQLKETDHQFYRFIKTCASNYAELQSMDEYMRDEDIMGLLQNEQLGQQYLEGSADDCPKDVARFYYKDGKFPDELGSLFEGA